MWTDTRDCLYLADENRVLAADIEGGIPRTPREPDDGRIESVDARWRGACINVLCFERVTYITAIIDAWCHNHNARRSYGSCVDIAPTECDSICQNAARAVATQLQLPAAADGSQTGSLRI